MSSPATLAAGTHWAPATSLSWAVRWVDVARRTNPYAGSDFVRAVVSSLSVTALGWRAYFTRRGLPLPVAEADLLVDPAGLDRWLDEHDVLDGQPFLLDPLGRYDVTLNLFFTAELFAEPRNTQLAVAHDLKRFLTFLWESRGERSCRDASPEDRAAFKRWRLFDPEGPHVEFSTWDREVATVNRFYRWAVRRGHVPDNPILQREGRGSPFRRSDGREVPAEASSTGPRRRVAWLTPAMYRQWRDAGVRGLDLQGRPDPGFRGRFASRNAAYTDLMFRTGLRLAEQTSLSLFEVPELAGGVVNARAWLPARIAKGGSARHFYIPAPVLKDLTPLLILGVGLTGRNVETIKELPAEHQLLQDAAVAVTVVKRPRGKTRSRETVHWETGRARSRELHTPGGFLSACGRADRAQPQLQRLPARLVGVLRAPRREFGTPP